MILTNEVGVLPKGKDEAVSVAGVFLPNFGILGDTGSGKLESRGLKFEVTEFCGNLKLYRASITRTQTTGMMSLRVPCANTWQVTSFHSISLVSSSFLFCL